jgi:hypothetical protein
MTYSVTEREVIGLCIGLEATVDMVNHTLLTVSDLEGRPGEAEVRFKSRQHHQLFLARLLDFVKENGNDALTGVAGSCLQVLRASCRTRSFDHGNSVALLEQATARLDQWLSARTKLKLWLPALDVEAHLEVPRLDFLYISGNHVKHNLSRLTGVSKRIHRILLEHGHPVPLEQIPLALDDFQEHLEENFFSYYGTWLSEMANDIRWGLQQYLTPTFATSYTRQPGDDLRYSYTFPGTVANEVPRVWFWRLMNNIRSGPYVKRFVAPDYMKNEALEW